MSALESLFQAVGLRRRTQLADLRAERAQLVADHGAAVAAGDDDKADKIWAKVEKTDAAIRAAQSALDEEQRQTQARRLDAQRAEQQRLAESRRAAVAHLEREALRFDELCNGELVAQWSVVLEAIEQAHAACMASGVSLANHAPDLKPASIWSRVWLRASQKLEREWPTPISPSRTVVGLAEVLKNRAAADPQLIESR